MITTSSVSSGYTGASGNYNAGAAAISQPFNKSTSTYFEFTLTPDQGYSLTVNAIKFGSRSTSTGPKFYSIRTSIDSYNSDLVVGNLSVDSKWYLYNHSGFSFSNTNNNLVTFRIYGSDGAGASSNTAVWRIDDLSLAVSVAPVQTFFRSRQNGDWANPQSWEVSTDFSTWNTATTSPTKDAETILIQSGHTISVSTSVSLDQTSLAGTLQLQTGGVFNINEGTGDDISILPNGVLKIINSNSYSTSVIQSAGANINISAKGKITIGDGITTIGTGYEAFAISPNNKWNDGSVFEYNNNGVFSIAALTYFPNAAATEIPIFRITKVGGTIAAGTNNDFYLNGILEVMSDITFSGAGKKYFRNGIRGNAKLTQTGTGKFYLTNPNDLTSLNAILDGTSLKIFLSAVMDLAPNTTIPIGANITISGANISNSSKIFTINGTLDVTTINISNSGGVIILNGNYRTAHSGGFYGSGSSIPSGNITLNPGSTIELYALGDQSLNARTDFKNLIFSGSGTKIPIGSFNPAGTVTIKDNAVFDCSGRNIGDETDGQATSTNLTMTDNSRLIVDTYGPNPKMGGTYNLQGGIVEFKCSNLTPQTIRNKSYHIIEITGTNVLMSIGNISLNDGGTFTVKNGGVFAINDNTIIGSGKGTETITVESGGTLRCGNNQGFNGSEITSIPIKSSSIHKNITNIILEPNSTIEYSRPGDQPITNANGLIYQNLVLSGTGNKLAPPDNLIIEGNFSKTSAATFIHNNGTVIFNGNNKQNYSCTSPQIIFNNLTNKNSFGLNINDSLSVYKRLLLDNNSVINLNADVSLLSDKNQTAYLSRLGTNAIINYYNGRFIVERYINTNTINGGHNKSWQFISIPAFGETVFNTWQEKGKKNIAGYGTWITGVSNGDNSFDAISLAPSMKYYSVENNSWIGIQSTNINLEKEGSYMIFVRGDRRATSVNSLPTTTVLRTIGKLYEGNFSPPQIIAPAEKFQSVGNPYASAIDFEKISFSERQTSYVAWDPTLNGNYGFGGYQTISATTFYKAIPGNTSNYNTSSNYQNIQSGQAFFVYNSASSPMTVSFTDECKVDDAYHLVNRAAASERQILFASLFSEQGLIADGNAVAFGEIFSNKIDPDDALKMNKDGENFAIKTGQNILVVEARENVKAIDTVFYELTNLSIQEYKFVFISENFQTDLKGYLVDQYLNVEKEIDLIDTTVVKFSVTPDAASSRSNRFFLVLKRAAENAADPFLIKAYRKDINVILEWEDNNSSDIKGYEVEHSTDGIYFSLIKIIVSNGGLSKYNFLHNQPLNGNNYYRIKRVKINEKIEYSEIAKVLLPEFFTGIHVYPNPVRDENMNLQFIKQPAGKYNFSLFNSIGQRIFLKELQFAGGNSIQTIYLKKSTPNGIYNLQIIKPDGEKIFLKVRK
ncbi:MAG: hypothetical protein ABI148_02290 [Ginsengibacter sp.]